MITAGHFIGFETRVGVSHTWAADPNRIRAATSSSDRGRGTTAAVIPGQAPSCEGQVGWYHPESSGNMGVVLTTHAGGTPSEASC
jgi:hypothetical protein